MIENKKNKENLQKYRVIKALKKGYNQKDKNDMWAIMARNATKN